jgi:hypothetical protein
MRSTRNPIGMGFNAQAAQTYHPILNGVSLYIHG